MGDQERAGHVPEVTRRPFPAFAPRFLAVLGGVPFAMLLVLALLGQAQGIWGTLVLPILAICLVALRGQHVEIHRRRLLPAVWLVCVMAPAAIVALLTLAAPQAGYAQDVNFPARALAKPLTQAVIRRSASPPAVIGGDSALAAPLALATRSRPLLMPDGDPRLAAPSIRQLAASKGVLLVWRVSDQNRGAPLALRELWPGLVPEIPITAMWPIAGRLEPVRVGWAIVPPSKP
jgi:hypothetical protein